MESDKGTLYKGYAIIYDLLYAIIYDMVYDMVIRCTWAGSFPPRNQ